MPRESLSPRHSRNWQRGKLSHFWWYWAMLNGLEKVMLLTDYQALHKRCVQLLLLLCLPQQLSTALFMCSEHSRGFNKCCWLTVIIFAVNDNYSDSLTLHPEMPWQLSEMIRAAGLKPSVGDYLWLHKTGVCLGKIWCRVSI